MMRRLSAIALTLVSILFLPYWVYFAALALSIALIPFFWEGVLLALLIELIHGGEGEIIENIFSPIVALTFMLIILMVPIREKLRFNV